MLAALLLLFQPLAAQPGRFGLPACSAPDQELAARPAFMLCHSSSWKVPAWTAYELKPEHLAASAPRPKHFRHDPLLSGPSAFDSDYRHSGFIRGHMVPARDLAWSHDALQASYFLSNVAPQNGSLNSGKWAQLEKAVRSLASASDSVIVLTGPIFCESIQRIGASLIAVPCQLFKVVLAIRDSHLTMFAAILPNHANPPQSLRHFAASVAEVERLTGLDFFHQLPLPVQLTLESTVVPIQP
jgi:endonuclease G